MFILDNLYNALPRPRFSDEETGSAAGCVYNFVWQRGAARNLFTGLRTAELAGRL
jgi:hypothetical protein